MPYCENCGSEINDLAVLCPNCGYPTKKGDNQEVHKYSNNDSGSFGWFCLGFCIPIAGIVLFFVWSKERPNTAKMLLIGALISFGLGFISGFLQIISGIYSY